MEQTRSGWGQALHIIVGCSFAFAQPIFDVVGRNPTFFVAHETPPVGVGVFAVVVLLLPAVLLIGLHRVARAISVRLGDVVLTATIGVLIAMTLIVPLGRILDLGLLSGLAAFVTIATATALAYRNIAAMRRLMTVLSFAPAVFLVLFLTSTSVRVLLASDTGVLSDVEPSDTPVVMLVLDELSLGTIQTSDGEIDDARFPGFGELADRSTWYPNATTNAYVTPVALPAITTGVFPRTDPKGEIPAPVIGVYPENLFTLLGRTHDLHSSEFVTRLCPTNRCPGAIPKGRARKLLISDTTIVYLRTVLPGAVADRWVPSIGSKWANFLGGRESADRYVDRLPALLRPVARPFARFFSYAQQGRGGEVGRMDAFLDELGRGSGPELDFLHLNLPHDPYQYLPDLKRYAGESFGSSHIRWPDDDAVTDAALQRYVLQVKATDELVERLVARLVDEKSWDASLVVVMADHGVSFASGGYRRLDDRQSAGQVVPIPLFVKYPHQRAGKIDRREAQMIDVLPTVADVLDVDVPWKVDGVSLRFDRRPDRPQRVFSGGAINTYRDVSSRSIEIAERIADLFGSTSGPDDLYAWGPHASLVGSRVDDLRPARAADGEVRLDDPVAFEDVDTDSSLVPAALTATFSGDPPRWVAVALNGTVAGLGQLRSQQGEVRIAVILSPRYLKNGPNRVEVFTVDGRSRLQRLSMSTDVTVERRGRTS